MEKIALVYGNFNILHPGHLRLLKFAKESSDYLIVAVNSDKFNKEINLLDEETRLESIKGTNYVDESFLLDEDILEYIKRRKPDILVKGKEFENRYNPEEEILKSYGGKILFSSGEIGFSSLNLLKDFDTSFLNLSHDNSFIKRHKIEESKLVDYINKFSNLNVLVIGDTIIDEYITCEAIGMSQEDPTIVVTPISNKKFIGGAAIVASHAKTLGANVSYISVLGDDENFEFTQNYLTSLRIDTYLLKDETRPTTLKQRFRAQNKTLLRVNHLKQHNISKDLEEKIVAYIVGNTKKLNEIIEEEKSFKITAPEPIEINDLVLKANTVYRLNVLFHASSGDVSQVGTTTFKTGINKHVNVITNLNELDLDFDNEIRLVKKANVTYVEYHILHVKDGVITSILDRTITTSDMFTLPVLKGTLKLNNKYILKIKTSLDSVYYVNQFTTF